MTRERPPPTAAHSSLGAQARAALHSADDFAVAQALDLESELLASARQVTRHAAALPPAIIDRFVVAFAHLAEQTQHWSGPSDSVLAASVAPAALRTVAILRRWSSSYGELARTTIDTLFGGGRTTAEELASEYEALGKIAAATLRDGLDPHPAGRDVRARLRRIRSLEARRQRKGR